VGAAGVKRYCRAVVGQEGTSMYYEYRQNNTRGYFKKPAHIVFVEATTPVEANARFITIDGCYFDPDTRFDCGCCGSRWTEANSYDTHTEEKMREIITDAQTSQLFDWDSSNTPLALIFHNDGTKESIDE
jgi:hypothetical protein